MGAEVGRNVGTPAYDAFISYSHDDQAVATRVQSSLQRIGRRRGQVRALKVFRDGTDMNASPNLWADVERALHSSRYLVTVASPAAASSTWVNREFDEWLRTRDAGTVLIGVAGGTLDYDRERNCFTEDSTAALPRMKEPDVFPHEPLFVDLRDLATLGARSPLVRERMVSLAAPVHGKEKRELFDSEVRDWRRNRRLRIGVAVMLALLLVTSVVGGAVAVRQRQTADAERRTADEQRAIAVQQRNQAVGTSLASASREVRSTNPALSIALALEAVHAAPDVDETIAALIQARFDFDRAPAVPFPPIEGDSSAEVVAISPDGAEFATSDGLSESIELRATSDGAPVGSIYVPNGADALAYSPDGSRIAIATYDGLYVADRDAQSATWVSDFGDQNIVDAEWDPRGRFLLLSTERGVVVIDAEDYTLRDRIMSIRRFGSDAQIAISPRGRHVAAVFEDRISVWPVGRGGRLGRPLKHRWDEEVSPATGGGLSFQGEHRLLAMSTRGLLALGIDARNDYLWEEWTGPAVNGEILRAAYPIDRHRLVVRSDSEVLEVWDGETRLGSFVVDDHEVEAAAVSPDGSTLVAVANDTTLWDVTPLRRLGPPRFGGTSYNGNVAFLDDDRLVAPHNDHVFVWSQQDDGATAAVKRSAEGEFPGFEWAYEVDVSRDGRTLAAVNDESVAFRRDGGRPVLGRFPDLVGRASGPRLSDDGSVGVVGLDNGYVLAVDPETAELIVALPGPGADPWAVDVSPDGSRVAGAFGGSIAVWTLPDPEPDFVQEIGFDAVRALAYSPDGRRLAATSGDGEVALVDASDGEVVTRFRGGHTGILERVTFSPDGRLVATGGGDHSVRIWSAQTGEQLALARLPGTTSWVHGIAFSPDGSSLAWGEEDSFVYWPGLFDTDAAGCDVVAPYLTDEDVRPYLPEDWEPLCSFG